jgi:prophage regulatory protein
MSNAAGVGASPRLLPAPEVRWRTSLSRATIWRRVRSGEFPAPVRLGPNRIAWLESDVNAWIQDQLAGGDRA